MKIFVLLALLVAQPVFAKAKTYKLYAKPFAKVDTFCDVYTELKLQVDGSFGHAELENKLAGTCELHVSPNRRSYNLVLDRVGECGETVYKQHDDAEELVTVVDNRTATCENVLPGLIVLMEYDQNGNEHRLYSLDR